MLTYYFFRSNKNKDKMKKTELSDIDKEELTKIEKIVGKRIPYTFANEKGLEFQIIEFIRPGYIKRRIFDHRGHCHYLIKYNLDRSIVEFIVKLFLIQIKLKKNFIKIIKGELQI